MCERQKAEHPPFWKSFRNYFREYCKQTSIHGFRYFGEKRTCFERFWWIIVFSITLATCVYAIYEVYQKWVRSPVIVSFATKETPIYSIPFPAVTVCLETKSQLEHYNNTEMIQKFIRAEFLTETEQRQVDYMGMVCDRNIFIDYSNTETFGDEFFDHIEKVSPRPPILRTHFLGQTFYSGKFQPIITDVGICHSFNILDRSEIFRDNVKHYKTYHTVPLLTKGAWSTENGYSENAGLNPYPLRALFAGAKNSLDVYLVTPKADIDHTCKSSLQGFRVTLHLPSRIPRPSQEYFTVPFNEMVLATIYPTMMTTSESVKAYSPQKRECYFSTERYLKYFKIYTSNNCKLECLTNHTLYLCGCVKFFMPRDNDTYICGTGNLDCMVKAEQNYELGNLRRKLQPKRGILRRMKVFDIFPPGYPVDCDCKPICSDLSYDAVTSQNPYERVNFLRALHWNVSAKFPEERYYFSRLKMFFKSSQFITSQRHELYGPTDFLANFGGLLGLFTGFSILSLMEAIYFLTIRLCCNLKLYGYWAGPDIS